jgi:hypothetical protein
VQGTAAPADTPFPPTVHASPATPFSATCAAPTAAPQTSQVQPSRRGAALVLPVIAGIVVVVVGVGFAIWRASHRDADVKRQVVVVQQQHTTDHHGAARAEQVDGAAAALTPHTSAVPQNAGKDAAPAAAERSHDARPAARTRRRAPQRGRGTSAPREGIPLEARRKVSQALMLLNRGQYAEARRVARQSFYGGRPSTAALVIVAVSYCGQRDLGNARTHMRNVPRAARQRARLKCRRLGLDL